MNFIDFHPTPLHRNGGGSTTLPLGGGGRGPLAQHHILLFIVIYVYIEEHVLQYIAIYWDN